LPTEYQNLPFPEFSFPFCEVILNEVLLVVRTPRGVCIHIEAGDRAAASMLMSDAGHVLNSLKILDTFAAICHAGE
jgi:hypothetical protein